MEEEPLRSLSSVIASTIPALYDMSESDQQTLSCLHRKRYKTVQDDENGVNLRSRCKKNGSGTGTNTRALK